MLIKIGLREDAAAARLVDDGRTDIEPPPVLQDFLERARCAIDTAARAHANNDFDIFGGLPENLRRSRACRRQHQYQKCAGLECLTAAQRFITEA
jgi:hypothetical protein